MTTLQGQGERPPAGYSNRRRSSRAGSWLGRVRVSALVLSLPLGCGESDERPPLLGAPRPVPGCEDFDYRNCDILTARCQRELFALAACMHGDADPGDAPPVRQLDEAAAIAFLEERSDGTMMMTDGVDAMGDSAADEAAFRAEVRGLELIGLLDPGTIETPGDVVNATVEDALAYYLVTAKEVVIIDRGEPIDDLDANAVLVHEFVHALQDRRHDLGSFGIDLTDSDGYLARSSLIEGEASLYQYLVYFAYSGSDVRTVNFPSFFDDLTAFGMELTLAAGSPALTADGIFPYTFGARYAGQHWVEGGSVAVDALYATPPRTSWEVLGGEAPTEVAAFAQAPAPLDGYEPVSDDVAGAWVSVAMLAGLEGASDIAGELPELASRWRGDHIWIYDSPGAGAAALWAIDWSSADAATRFAELAAAFTPAGGTLRIDTAGASTRITAVERAEDLEAWQARLAEAAP